VGEFKVDPKEIALMGESACDHLVSVVGARNRPPADMAAVVSFYGPIDLIKLFDVRPRAPKADGPRIR
jgi:acetyl esterase/lipase